MSDYHIGLYEELRAIIDGGSESMTHEDAVANLKYMQDEHDGMAAELHRLRVENKQLREKLAKEQEGKEFK